MSSGIKVELDLSEIRFPGDFESGIPSVTLEEMLVKEAAAQIVAQIGRDATERIRAAVNELRQEMIREQVAPLITDALTTSLQPTDLYGQPKGEPVTLREVIVKEAKAYLTEAHSERYGESKRTPVQRLIHEEVERAVKTELKAAMEGAKGEVAAAVREQGAAIISETISRMATR